MRFHYPSNVQGDIKPWCMIRLSSCTLAPMPAVVLHMHAQVREVVKHTPELAQLVVANGGVGALVEYCNDSQGNNRWGYDLDTCQSIVVAANSV